MKIEHVALWTRQLEALRDFYCRCFDGSAGPRYYNSRTGFRSYFVTFADGARLELMQLAGIVASGYDPAVPLQGWAHIAFSVGGREAVDVLTERLRADGVRIVSEPRTTGDGYYESVILDPDGNRVEITI